MTSFLFQNKAEEHYVYKISSIRFTYHSIKLTTEPTVCGQHYARYYSAVQSQVLNFRYRVEPVAREVARFIALAESKSKYYPDGLLNALIITYKNNEYRFENTNSH